MPIVPSAPTDNLYKFLSIFGLALVISGLVLGHQSEETLVRTNRAYMRQSRIILLHDRFAILEDGMGDSVMYARLADRQFPGFETLVTHMGISPHDRISAVEATQNRTEIQASGGGVKRDWASLRAAVIRGDSMQIELDGLSEETEEVRGLLVRLKWLVGSGFLVSALGFVLWYYRVQRHEDGILRNRLTDSSATKLDGAHDMQ